MSGETVGMEGPVERMKMRMAWRWAFCVSRGNELTSLKASGEESWQLKMAWRSGVWRWMKRGHAKRSSRRPCW